MTPMNYRLTPSDLTFLYEGCKHCFVMKVKYGIAQPSIPIPGVFSVIASLQKDYYSNRRLEEICPGFPPGTIKYGEKWVKSENLRLSGSQSTCYISGRFDIVAELDDRSYAILDFKTGSPSTEKSAMYSRQLHSYIVALENPAQDALKLTPISKLGLIYFTPDRYENVDMSRQSLEGQIECVDIKRDDNEFLSFLSKVVNLLDGPLPAIEGDKCDWCKYHTKKSNLNLSTEVAGNNPKCPKCESDMQLKSGKYGDFWSCVKFPDCKGTRNI
jgi:Topoisomerase DNA binding C4 zinc finger/PD-(D/E)XK nuclease superfamily